MVPSLYLWWEGIFAAIFFRSVRKGSFTAFFNIAVFVAEYTVRAVCSQWTAFRTYSDELVATQ